MLYNNKYKLNYLKKIIESDNYFMSVVRYEYFNKKYKRVLKVKKHPSSQEISERYPSVRKTINKNLYRPNNEINNIFYMLQKYSYYPTLEDLLSIYPVPVKHRLERLYEKYLHESWKFLSEEPVKENELDKICKHFKLLLVWCRPQHRNIDRQKLIHVLENMRDEMHREDELLIKLNMKIDQLDDQDKKNNNWVLYNSLVSQYNKRCRKLRRKFDRQKDLEDFIYQKYEDYSEKKRLKKQLKQKRKEYLQSLREWRDMINKYKRTKSKKKLQELRKMQSKSNDHQDDFYKFWRYFREKYSYKRVDY